MRIPIQLDCRIFNPVQKCHGFLSSTLYKGRQLLQISRGGHFQNFPPCEYWCSTLIPPQVNICLSGFSSHTASMNKIIQLGFCFKCQFSFLIYSQTFLNEHLYIEKLLSIKGSLIFPINE
jgi:hypothetical protein